MIKPESSRQQQILLMLLNTPAGLSIDDMAERLEISRTAVKQHLVGLEKQALIQEATLNHATGGRPARNYSLTEQGINQFPKQYAWFCNLLLAELAETLTLEALEDLMRKLGVKLANSLAPQFQHLTAADKLTALIELMQKLGFHATQEPLADGTTQIKAINCIYHDLAQQHPALCQFDQALLSTLSGNAVTQTHCMAKQDCDCRFLLSKKTAKHI